VEELESGCTAASSDARSRFFKETKMQRSAFKANHLEDLRGVFYKVSTD